MSSVPSYPSVVTREVDLSTTVTTGNITSFGAIAINSTWGAANEVNLITSENDLVNYFGAPTSNTYVDFFVAANFLSYSASLNVVRVCDSSARNAVSGNTSYQVQNFNDYESNHSSYINSGTWISKFPGTKGNSLFVAACDSGVNFSSGVDSANTLGTWSNYFSTIPGTSTIASQNGGVNDEVHIIVIDAKGEFTGTKGAVLETWPYLSKSQGAVSDDGTNNYYKDVINNRSRYIWTGDKYLLGSNSSCVVSTSYVASGNTESYLTGAVDVNSSNTAMYVNGYEHFSDRKSVDVSHLIAGNIANESISGLINIAENRGDCIVFISPKFTDVQPGQNQSTISQNIVTFKNNIGVASSYYFVDGNWKYQYDKYNDVNRWIPCCGDVAGLKAQAEYNNDVWWNGSGYNRGLLKNVIKLAWNPKDSYMGQIYQNSVNPIIIEGGSVVLLGDKTGLNKTSAFSRINVRSLFNIVKRQISNYLKYSLFDFNDEFTRIQLSTNVETYLQSIKSRRGIQDFVVVCNSTNNPSNVIDNNQLNIDVYIKPNLSINWITLSVVNVAQSTSFSEVVGKAF